MRADIIPAQRRNFILEHIRQLKKKLMLIDSFKFGQVVFAEAFAIDRSFAIITDRPLPRPVIKMIEEKGAMVTVI